MRDPDEPLRLVITMACIAAAVVAMALWDFYMAR
jgi:hypothetical protein